jgi:cobalt/nickel transport protein
MKKIHYAILVACLVVLFVAPLVMFPDADYEGADGIVEDIISEGDYEPWIDSIWEPPSGEIESLLFALQAGIGALIIGYFVGYERGKRKGIKQANTNEQKIGN